MAASPHPGPEAIDRYAARQLSAADAAAIRQHLLGCPPCRERLRASPFYPEAGRRETEVIAGLKDRPGCPEPSARVAYAVNALSPERRADLDAHVRACDDCGRDLRTLATLRAGAEGSGTAAGRPGCLLSLWRPRRGS